MKILIIGAGYIGLKLGRELLRRGSDVTGWVAAQNSEEKVLQAGLQVICADVSLASSWKKVSREWDAIVYCASSSRQGAAAYRAIHQDGINFALKCKTKHFIYTSSTSVYGQTDGSEVNEQSPTNPLSETSEILLGAEKRILDAGGTVARLAGIYGPQRGYLFQKIATHKKIEEHERWINQIHRGDAVGAILFFLEKNKKGLFNVCDDEPVLLSEFCKWICELLKKPLVQIVPPKENSRKRGVTNKKVSNVKLRSHGWELIFPTFREGYTRGMYHLPLTTCICKST